MNIIKKKRQDRKRTKVVNHVAKSQNHSRWHWDSTQNGSEMTDCFPNNHKDTQGQHVKTVVRSDAAQHENTHSHTYTCYKKIQWPVKRIVDDEEDFYCTTNWK